MGNTNFEDDNNFHREMHRTVHQISLLADEEQIKLSQQYNKVQQQQQQTNMKEEKQQKPKAGQQKSQLIELFISCRNLADLDTITVTDSYLVIKMKQGKKQEKTILKTKVYQNDLNPNYAQTVTIDFVFEIRQKLKFEVYHEDDPPQLVGQTESTLGQIFGSPSNGIRKDLLNDKNQKSGEIIVKCEKKQKLTNNQLSFQLSATDLPPSCFLCCFGCSCNFFFRIFRKRKQDQLLIYESETIERNSNPKFSACELSERRLCRNNVSSDCQVRVFRHAASGNHQEIGSASFTVNKILDTAQIQLKNKSNKKVGMLSFNNIKRSVENKFTDYLASGLQLMLITCIDFTASNGPITDPQSLHFLHPKKKSPYEQALEQVSRILLDFDYDKLVPVYGFGAKCMMPKFNSHGQAHHCFPLNGNVEDAHVYMVEGIMQAYRNALKYLQFSGPTYFKVLLNLAIQQCYQIQQQTNQYMIVFILTDGDIHDYNIVVDQVVECCSLPISIIIVGIGDNQFDVMEKLNDNDLKLVDSKGRKTTRDLVTFVEFRKFRNNGVELAEKVLEELPRQVEDYYKIMNIGPDRLKDVNELHEEIPKLPQQMQQSSIMLIEHNNSRKNISSKI